MKNVERKTESQQKRKKIEEEKTKRVLFFFFLMVCIFLCVDFVCFLILSLAGLVNEEKHLFFFGVLPSSCHTTAIVAITNEILYISFC